MNRFHIVIENIWRRLQDLNERGVLTSEIGDENFDLDPGIDLPDQMDRFCVVRSSPIGQVITGDRSQHHVLKPHLSHRFSHFLWFVLVGRRRYPPFHGAKATIPGTNPAQDENRRRPLGKTLSQVRAPGLFTHRMELASLQDDSHPFEILNRRKPFLEPGWFLQSFHREKPKSFIIITDDFPIPPPSKEKV